jgi:O-antigen/teichoic acid export membrane protein
LKINYKKAFYKNILTLTFGSLIAQIINVACFPLITRLFTQSEIGTYTFVLSFSAIFMGIANTRFDLAIVKEKNQKNVYALVKLSFFVGLLVTILSSIIYFLYLTIEPNQNNEIPFWTLPFFSVLVFSYAILNLLTAYNNRKKEYKIISLVYIYRSFSQAIGPVLLGILMKIGALALLISYAVGQFLGVKKQYSSLRKEKKEILKSNRSDMKEVFRIHKNQLYYSTPAQLVNSLSYSAITIAVKTLFDLSTVGLYSISVRLLGLPLSLIAGNVSKVYYESAASEYNETGSMLKTFKKTFLMQLFLAIPMVLFTYFLGPILCSFFLGESWRLAGEFIQILAPMFGIRLIVTVLMPTFIIANKQKKELLCQIFFVFSLFISFLISKFTGASVDTFLKIVTFNYFCVYLFVLINLYMSAKK